MQRSCVTFLVLASVALGCEEPPPRAPLPALVGPPPSAASASPAPPPPAPPDAPPTLELALIDKKTDACVWLSQGALPPEVKIARGTSKWVTLERGVTTKGTWPTCSFSSSAPLDAARRRAMLAAFAPPAPFGVVVDEEVLRRVVATSARVRLSPADVRAATRRESAPLEFTDIFGHTRHTRRSADVEVVVSVTDDLSTRIAALSKTADGRPIAALGHEVALVLDERVLPHATVGFDDANAMHLRWPRRSETGSVDASGSAVKEVDSDEEIRLVLRALAAPR